MALIIDSIISSNYRGVILSSFDPHHMIRLTTFALNSLRLNQGWNNITPPKFLLKISL